jgi:hypothetical protein
LLSAKERSLPKSSKTLTGIIAPLLRSSPTDYATLYKALYITQGISAIVTGPNHKTIITLDLDLYKRAVKLQQANGISNWFLRIGELHMCFASLHALRKYIEASGIDVVSIEEGIYIHLQLYNKYLEERTTREVLNITLQTLWRYGKCYLMFYFMTTKT